MFTGLRDGDHLGNACRHLRHRNPVHCDGSDHPFYLRSLVHVLRSRLLHPVPSTPDGRSLQASLQHVRVALSVHHGVPGPRLRWRTSAGAGSVHPLSGLRLWELPSNVSFPDDGYADVANHPRRCFVVVQVSFFCQFSYLFRIGTYLRSCMTMTDAYVCFEKTVFENFPFTNVYCYGWF